MFVLYWDKISGERLQDHWFSGLCFASYFANLISKSSKFQLKQAFRQMKAQINRRHLLQSPLGKATTEAGVHTHYK